MGSTSFWKSTGAGWATGAMEIPAGRVAGRVVGGVEGAARETAPLRTIKNKTRVKALNICVSPCCIWLFFGRLRGRLGCWLSRRRRRHDAKENWLGIKGGRDILGGELL